ncbi:MAG: ABC transporter ATP-binding protein [Tissierellia bacterium]|nr:ABC transporter ATP-binding protein [Tissierellia bacterium]
MESIIKVKNLRKSYDKKMVLDGIDFEIYPGEIIGYIGPNGAGKSTTVKIMLGIIGNYSGDIEIMGQKIQDSDYEYKKYIGYVPETASLYESLSAKEYLSFVGGLHDVPDKAVEEKAYELCRLFGLEDKYNMRLSSYSKGMKQKILFIAAILHDPKIIFLDEPLSGIDANSIAVIKELMNKLAQSGKTIFYSSHIMDVVEKISSRIILINEGRIAADGTIDEIREEKSESLESLFTKITGFDDASEIANNIMGVLNR